MPGYVSSTADLIAAAVARYISDLEIGEHVYQARLYSPANLAGDDAAMAATGLGQKQLDVLGNTYVIRALHLGLAPAPTSNGDMVIPFNSAPVCAPVNVTVTIALAAAMEITQAPQILTARATVS